MSYEIHILSDEEFDKLPYKRTKEALGMADAKRNVAYVRKTGVAHLDRHTLEHEFDEMLQRVSPHEEDGIRYKIPIIPLIFSGLKTIGSAAVGAGKLLGGTALKGIGALGKGALGGAKFLGGKALSGAKALSGFGSSGGLGGVSTKGFTSIATPAGVSSVTIPGISSSVPLGLAKLGSSALGKFAIGAAKSTAVNKATSALQQKFLGPGISGFNNLPGGAGGQSGALARFANPVTNVAGTFGVNQLQESDVSEGFANIDQNSNLRRKSVFDSFAGQTPDGNSRFAQQLANINIGTEREKRAFLDEANKVNQQRETRKQLQKINGLSDAQFDEFLELARTGSDAEITSKFNQDPKSFRDVFSIFF